MTRFFVPLDVNYQLDDKIMCAGPLAECLYIRSLALAKRAGTEGRIKRSQLRALALGLPGKPEKYAQVLDEVGLWEPTADGWYITGWLKHNLTNGALAEQKAKIKAKSVAGNHKRHHVAKGIIDEDCELCNPPNGDPKLSLQGTLKLPTEEEEERDSEREHDCENEDESSSSSRELQAPVDKPEDEEDDPISAAMTIVAQQVTAARRPDDPFAYQAKIRTDPKRIDDLERLHRHHPGFNAEQLAALHGGRELARVTAMTEPEVEPEPIPVSTYTPPAPAQPVATCTACGKPCALVTMTPKLCSLAATDMRPADCAVPIAQATIHPIRGATA